MAIYPECIILFLDHIFLITRSNTVIGFGFFAFHMIHRINYIK